MIKVYRIVPKERDRRGYELAAVFDSEEKLNRFLRERDNDKTDHFVYAVGTPKKKAWWKFW